jgi:hypothetical protein
MLVRAVLRGGAALGVLLLPLICLCGFTPGQAGRAPYLLLFPAPHPAAVEALSDDALADLAFASGQAVSVTDDGALTFGYGGDGAPAGADAGPAVQRPSMPAEQSPTLDALIPTGPPPGAPAARDRAAARPAVAAPRDRPAPPTPPPRA